jgi:hypothetical protein
MISATPSGFLTNQGANISIEDFPQGQYRFPKEAEVEQLLQSDIPEAVKVWLIQSYED